MEILHSGRSLSNERVKKVECVMQSISSTHLYIVQPIILCNGNLLSVPYLLYWKKLMVYLDQEYKKPYLFSNKCYCKSTEIW